MTTNVIRSNKVAEPETTYVSDDSLETPEVGAWAERKYDLVHYYDQLFAKGMKEKWGTRVYLDLFSGAGKVRIRRSNKILLGSPLLAFNITDRYDKYIFCDENEALLKSLKARVARDYSDADVSYVEGDCNKRVDEIMRYIPKPSRSNRVLTFCFVDPFSLNIEFKTIKKLATLFMDFLILLAFPDAGRNERIYMDTHNDRIDKFLGDTSWRKKWNVEMKKGESFVRFLEKQYLAQMISLGYLTESAKLMIEVRSDDRNLSLYHLAFFSRSKLGYQFWKEVKKYALTQPELF